MQENTSPENGQRQVLEAEVNYLKKRVHEETLRSQHLLAENEALKAKLLQAASCIDSPEANDLYNIDLNEQDYAFKVLSGLMPPADISELAVDSTKLIAFYLPQYHRIKENSEWWGAGFTEWTNVVTGEPNYRGHYQPHLPRDLGFYDLSNVNVMREQAEMAKLYGVSAFCFYYYWFSGRRVLETPIDNFLKSDVNIEYCLCWANENWTRTWDGDNHNVLLEQKYLESDPVEFITSLIPHFLDKRYIRVDNKPLLVVYRAKDIPNPAHVFKTWRKIAAENGIPDIHIAAVDFYDIKRPEEVGADALVEFPPHKFNGIHSMPSKMPEFINKNFKGSIVDYSKVVTQSAKRKRPDFTLYRGVVPSWDNTARRQNTPTIFYGSSPELFADWLSYIRAYTRDTFQNRDDKLMFVNAWNEWGEGCHLEPDQRWGFRYLEAVKLSSRFNPNTTTVESTRNKLLSTAASEILRRDQIKSESSSSELNSIKNSSSDGKTYENPTIARRVAYSLQKYPFAYQIARAAYRLCKSI